MDSYITKYRCLPMFANVLGMFLIRTLGSISKPINHLCLDIVQPIPANGTLLSIGPLTLIVTLQCINVCQCLLLFANVCQCLPMFANVCQCLPLFANDCWCFWKELSALSPYQYIHFAMKLSNQFQWKVTLIRIGPLTSIVTLQCIDVCQGLRMCINVFDRSYRFYFQTNKSFLLWSCPVNSCEM